MMSSYVWLFLLERLWSQRPSWRERMNREVGVPPALSSFIEIGKTHAELELPATARARPRIGRRAGAVREPDVVGENKDPKDIKDPKDLKDRNSLSLWSLGSLRSFSYRQVQVQAVPCQTAL